MNRCITIDTATYCALPTWEEAGLGDLPQFSVFNLRLPVTAKAYVGVAIKKKNRAGALNNGARVLDKFFDSVGRQSTNLRKAIEAELSAGGVIIVNFSIGRNEDGFADHHEANDARQMVHDTMALVSHYKMLTKGRGRK